MQNPGDAQRMIDYWEQGHPELENDEAAQDVLHKIATDWEKNGTVLQVSS